MVMIMFININDKVSFNNPQFLHIINTVTSVLYYKAESNKTSLYARDTFYENIDEIKTTNSEVQKLYIKNRYMFLI